MLATRRWNSPRGFSIHVYWWCGLNFNHNAQFQFPIEIESLSHVWVFITFHLRCWWKWWAGSHLLGPQVGWLGHKSNEYCSVAEVVMHSRRWEGLRAISGAWGSSSEQDGARGEGALTRREGLPPPAFCLACTGCRLFFISEGKCYSTTLSKIGTMAEVSPEEDYNFWVCFNVWIPKGSRHCWERMTSGIYFPLDRKESLHMCSVSL